MALYQTPDKTQMLAVFPYRIVTFTRFLSLHRVCTSIFFFIISSYSHFLTVNIFPTVVARVARGDAGCAVDIYAKHLWMPVKAPEYIMAKRHILFCFLDGRVSAYRCTLLEKTWLCICPVFGVCFWWKHGTVSVVYSVYVSFVSVENAVLVNTKCVRPRSLDKKTHWDAG